jgi:hypothetical protein
MNDLQLKKISRDIIERAEKGLVPGKGLPKVIDEYFIQQLKQDEMRYAAVDPRLHENLRRLVNSEVLPLYEQYLAESARIRERKQQRKLWQYVLGTVVACEIVEAILTRGRSILPQALIPTAILYSFLGAILYVATHYLDDLQLGRARKRLDRAIEGLESRVQTDVDYDSRRELMDEDILRGEVVEILAQYERPDDFWRDYSRVRQADPTSAAEFAALNLPAFGRFLKFHLEDRYSAIARQQRFNRLFVQAHEIFISRERDDYVMKHLKNITPKSP